MLPCYFLCNIIIAPAVGADLSANSSPNYQDNHENFAAEAAPTVFDLRVKPSLEINRGKEKDKPPLFDIHLQRCVMADAVIDIPRNCGRGI